MLPIVPHKVILPNGRTRTKYETRRRTVIPSNGDKHMRCGKCGNTDFTIHLRPNDNGMGEATLTNIVCSLCGNIYPTGRKITVGGTLKIEETRNVEERDKLNAKPDN